jgi:hypothetical protein
MVQEVRYPGGGDVVLGVQLCPCCNPSPGPATLWFAGVRNFEEVKQALEGARRSNQSKPYIDELVCVLRGENGVYILGLSTAGAVEVDAKGLHES